MSDESSSSRNQNYYDLNFQQAAALVIACWRARRAHGAKVVPLAIGAPGTGKTELGKMLSKATARPFVPQEMQGAADEDINGIPTRMMDPAGNPQVWRFLIGPLRAACAVPSVLMLDEIDRSGAQKQGVLLPGLRERRFGDNVLNAETDMLLAGNGASSGGTHNFIAAFLNRCLPFNFVQSEAEVREFLTGGWRKVQNPDPISLDVPGWTPEQLNTALEELMLDFGATSEKAPKLIATEAPEGAEETGAPWASGRAVHEGLKVLNVALASGLTGDVLQATLAGCIGKEAAGSFFSIRKVRDRLPSPTEIEQKPREAKVPEMGDVEANIGVLGLAAIAASRNADSAWRYAERIQNREIQHALCKGLMRFTPKDPDAYRIKMMMMGRGGLATEA